MSDLGSKAALLSDINAKVTTNGNGENTGARVRAALTNMVDTLDGLKEAAFVPFIYLTSGSVTAAYRKQGTLNGKDWFVKVGSTATEEYPENSVLWTDGGDGWGWYISTDSAIVLYYSTEDVATPDLVETWKADTGTGALPSVAYYGETSQEGMEALAAATSGAMIEMVVTQSGTDAPVAVAIRKTNTNVDVSFTRDEEGLFYLTATGFITTNCLLQITANENGRIGQIHRADDDTAYFGYTSAEDGCTFSITLKQL